MPRRRSRCVEQARIFTESFAGYVGGSFATEAAGLARFLSAQGADLCYSLFARRAGELAEFGYIARTGNISRLAARGVVPAARRSGVARELLQQLVEAAKTRGDEIMMLEVIEQNPSAHAL